MRNRLPIAALLVLVGLAAARANAQQLSGTVSDSASGTPVSGAVVMLIDSAGATLAQTISNIAGNYSLFTSALPTALRIRRLGFRPRTIPLTSPLPQRLDVRVTRIPTLLQPVNVAVAANCPRRPDREAALGLLDQARAGLLTAIVARAVSPAASMTRLDFRRWIGSSDRADSMSVTFDSVGRTANSYKAVRSAREFIRDGFVFDPGDGDTVHYFGPDADVLLDERFGQGYCFHLRREASRKNQLGIAFLPARRERGRIDVDGTLWVDTLARELRDIEFKYLGLPARTETARPGGRISFWTMPNGLVFIDSWHLRYPRLVADTQYVASRQKDIVRDWIEAVEGGGEVARAVWQDSSTFAGSLAIAHGRAVDLQGRSINDVVIRLRGTDYVTSPGTGGYFEFGQLVPGPYTVDVIDPSVARLGIVFPTALRFVAKRDSVTEVRLLVPATEELVVVNCDGRSWPGPQRQPGPLVVKLTQQDKPLAGAPWEIRRRVGADWQYVVERRRTGADGLIYTCLQYDPGDEIELRVFREEDQKFFLSKLSIGRRGTKTEIEIPPAPTKLKFRPSAERQPACPRDTIGSPCVSSP